MISISMGDLLSAAKAGISYFKKKRIKKIPEGQFIKWIETRYRIKLSAESKQDLLYSLEAEGKIKLMQSRYGKSYVVPGEIDW